MSGLFIALSVGIIAIIHLLVIFRGANHIDKSKIHKEKVNQKPDNSRIAL